jgi:hypothetical protein
VISQVEINARIRPLSDKEIVRFQLRVALFRRRRLSPEQAEFTADWIALRDQEKDDRRLCIECAHRQDDGGCFAARRGWLGPASTRLAAFGPDILHRCGAFQWQKP